MFNDQCQISHIPVTYSLQNFTCYLSCINIFLILKIEVNGATYLVLKDFSSSRMSFYAHTWFLDETVHK